MKSCGLCHVDMRCLKTGFDVDYLGTYRSGDLFGCPNCGSMSVHGITNVPNPTEVDGDNIKHIAGKVFSADGVYLDNNGYMVIVNVALGITKDFEKFMLEWNREFYEEFRGLMVVLKEKRDD